MTKAFKVIKIAAAVAIFFILAGLVTMNLWNWLVPLLFKGPIVTFWQAIGLLALSKILFGGFGRGGGGRFGARRRWRRRMEQRFAEMTPEEKEKFRADMQGRCGRRFDMNPFQEKNVAAE